VSRNEFSVVEFYDDGFHKYVDRWMDAHDAVHLARELIDRSDDHVVRIIITDGGDFTVFEWKQDLGVTFPPKEAK
jgi:hypothetical protein